MPTFTYKQLENEWFKKYGEFMLKIIDSTKRFNYHFDINFSKNSNVIGISLYRVPFKL